tara:strand:+ start:25637 stop:26542 length:906 start_codon:yes stop_codon:yes gene_type:complete
MTTEITSEKYKEQIIFMINNTLNGYNTYTFPGQNFINIEKKNTFKLKKFEYYIYKKNTIDTKRAVLYLFKDNKGENACIAILKDFTMFKINDINVLDEYYSGTLFDISFTPEKIIIYDTFLTGGYLRNKNTFIERINEAISFKHNLLSKKIDITVIDYKNVIDFDINEDEELFMIPNVLPLINGINYSAFKWKPCNLITFSLKVVENEENLDMYTTNFKQLKKFATIHNSDPEGKEYITQIKNLEKYKNECIIDLNILENKISILEVNTFKTLPNNIRSIEKIINIKNENISLEELVACFC